MAITKIADKLLHRVKNLKPLMDERGLEYIPDYHKNNRAHKTTMALGALGGMAAGLKSKNFRSIKTPAYGLAGGIAGLAAGVPISTQLHARSILKHDKKEQ